MRVALISCPNWATWSPHPALPLLSAQLRRAGHEARLFDLNIDAFRSFEAQDLSWWEEENSFRWEVQSDVEGLCERKWTFFESQAERIAEWKPQLLAFSVTSASKWVTPFFARILRQRMPQTPIVFGGPDCFRSWTCAQHMIPGVVDALCPGEGDLALIQLAEALSQRGEIPKDLPGFFTWDGASVRDNGDPQKPERLDDLAPISLDDVDLSAYTLTNRTTLMISRGCINRCAFCNESWNFAPFRTHSAEWMLAQFHDLLPKLRTGGPPHIHFNDSLINGNMAVLESMCDLIIAENLQFTWGGMALIRPELTLPVLEKMRKAGCIEICWGIESASTKVLRLMGKRYTTSIVDQVVHDAAKAGIDQYTMIMVGFPGEGPQEFAETLLFLLKNGRLLKKVGLPVFTPFKNSRVFSHPDRFGLVSLDDKDWATQDGENTPRVRALRRQILCDVLGDCHLEQGKFNDLKARWPVDLSLPETQKELADILTHFLSLTRDFLAQDPDRLPLMRDRLPQSG